MWADGAAGAPGSRSPAISSSTTGAASDRPGCEGVTSREACTRLLKVLFVRRTDWSIKEPAEPGLLWKHHGGTIQNATGSTGFVGLTLAAFAVGRRKAAKIHAHHLNLITRCVNELSSC